MFFPKSIFHPKTRAFTSVFYRLLMDNLNYLVGFSRQKEHSPGLYRPFIRYSVCRGLNVDSKIEKSYKKVKKSHIFSYFATKRLILQAKKKRTKDKKVVKSVDSCLRRNDKHQKYLRLSALICGPCHLLFLWNFDQNR